MVISGKVNMVIDGQFGSTGKGLIAAYIASHYHIDIVVGRLSPNAGHTFYHDGRKYVTKLIPVAGIIQPKATIYMSSGCVIDVDLFFKELDLFDIDHDRIIIHPRAAVISKEDKTCENNVLVSIGSTLSGSGSARATKILRTNPLAMGDVRLQKFVKPFELDEFLDMDLNVFVETGQGFDLGINSGYSYPYCTSIDVTPSSVLADLCIHPSYMGLCTMSVRTYPIRVGNPVDSTGNEIGTSGPVYPDSEELTWDDLNVAQEYTTVTKRVRRVFTFSETQYTRAVRMIKPDYIFLNFINYLTKDTIKQFNKLTPKPTHIGYGPYTEQIDLWDNNVLDNYICKWR